MDENYVIYFKKNFRKKSNIRLDPDPDLKLARL